MITAPTGHKTLKEMPAHARVWVYKSARTFGKAEQRYIHEQGAVFCAEWAAHGAPLDATVEVLHDRFVVVAVDEVQAQASGCSIDKSIGFIKDLEFQLNQMLTDRMIVVHEGADGIQCCTVQDVPQLIARGEMGADTIVYDDLVATVGDLEERFRIPLKESWLSRYL